jgi:hypothetical protein
MNKFITIVLIIILGIILFAGGLGVIFITKSDSTKSDSTESNPVQKNCINDCSGYGDCDTTSGNCTCYQGFSGIDCSIQCPNLCSKRGTCDNGNCICKSGFYGEECQFIKCLNDCSGNGTCNNQTGECSCTNGSIQPDCSNKCPGYPNNTCSGNGICNVSSGVCSCSHGFSGIDCSIQCPNLCSKRGTCDINGNCDCDQGYYGNDCSLSCPKDLMNNTCSGNGNCTFDGINIACICSQGYKGSDCSKRTCPGDPNNTCSGHGNCNTTAGSCNCNQGYYGNDCSVACPGADDNNICSGNGACSFDGTSTTICDCSSRYYGSNCESNCSNDNIFDDTNKVCKQKYLVDINGFQDFRVYNNPNSFFHQMLVNNRSNPSSDFNERFYIKKVTISGETRYAITNNNGTMFQLVKSTSDGSNTDTYYLKVTTNPAYQTTFKIFKFYNTFNLVGSGATSDTYGNAHSNLGSFIAEGKGNNVIRFVDNSFQSVSQPNNYQSIWDNMDERLNIKLDCIENCDSNCYCPTPPTPPSNTGPLSCKVVLPSNTSSIQRCVNNIYVYALLLSFGIGSSSIISSEVIYYLKDGNIVICVKYNNKYYFQTRRGQNSVELYSYSSIPTFSDFSNFDNFIKSVTSPVLTTESNVIHYSRTIRNFKIDGMFADDVYFLEDGDIIVCNLHSASTGDNFIMSRFGDNKSFYCVSSTTVFFTNFNNYHDFRSSNKDSKTFYENTSSKYSVKIIYGWQYHLYPM